MSLSANVERRIAEEVRGVVRTDPAVALRRAEDAFRQAQHHKRLSEHHKRRARVAKTTFAAFKRDLEALGIKVIIEGQSNRTTYPIEGGTSGRSNSQANGSD